MIFRYLKLDTYVLTIIYMVESKIQMVNTRTLQSYILNIRSTARYNDVPSFNFTC